MKEHTDNSKEGKEALDRHIVILYDISRAGIFDEVLTPRLNELLLSLLFDSPESLEEKVSQDDYAYMTNSLSNRGIAQPLVCEGKRVGITLAYTGISVEKKRRLNYQADIQQNISFDDYVNRFINGYFSSRDSFPITNTDTSSYSMREQLSRALPSERGEFRGWIMSLPTFSLPFSPRVACPNYFAAETLVIRITDLFSGNVTAQDNLEDLRHVADRYRERFQKGPLNELYLHCGVSGRCFLIEHRRPSYSTSVYIEVFRLQLPANLAQSLTSGQEPIPLIPKGNGYKFNSTVNLDSTTLAEAGLEPEWAEWHPTVETGTRLYELKNRLTSNGLMIPFSKLPNPYWDYKFRGFVFIAGRYNAGSTFGLSLPVIVQREWNDQILGKPASGYPWSRFLIMLFGSIIVIGVDLFMISRMREEWGVPWMEISDEYPSTHTLYTDDVDEDKQRYRLILYIDPINRPEWQATFFVHNTGDGILEVDLRLEGDDDYGGWKLRLQTKTLRVKAHDKERVMVRVDGRGVSAGEREVKKKLTVEPRNTTQEAVEIVLNLKCIDDLIAKPVGVDIGTVGSCVAVYPDGVLDISPGRETEIDYEQNSKKILRSAIKRRYPKKS